MKYPDSRSSLVHCRWTRASDGQSIPTLADEPGIAHALTDDCDLRSPKLQRFAKSWSIANVTDIDFDSGTRRAACGKIVRVILPIEFNDGDPSACPHCARSMKLRDENYSAWREDQRSMYERWHRQDAEVRAQWDRVHEMKSNDESQPES